MYDFSKISEIRLSEGSHTSAQDGVCFMEAIAFFAGERHSDAPDCACPVLTAYGVKLNDRMPDDVRNRLLRPLVPLVAGTRDKNNERKRAEFLAMWATNKVLPIALRERGFAKEADHCENAIGLSEAGAAARAAYAYAAAYAADAAADAAAASAAAESIWTVAVEGLHQAILIGRHDGFVVPEPVLAERHEQLRAMHPVA